VVQRSNLRRHNNNNLPITPRQRPTAMAASAPTSGSRGWRKSVSIVETPRPPGGWGGGGGRSRGYSTESNSSEEGSVFGTARKLNPNTTLARGMAVPDASTPIMAPLMGLTTASSNNNNNNNSVGYSRLLELRAAKRQEKYKYQDWIKSHCRLDLNLQEVAHIRYRCLVLVMCGFFFIMP
jgi:hypothetical protein